MPKFDPQITPPPEKHPIVQTEKKTKNGVTSIIIIIERID